MHICTVIARNYLAYARVLADSFRRHHPDGHVDVLIIDDDDHIVDDAGEAFSIWRPADLGMPAGEFGRMAMIYDVMELATAVKPFLLRRILEQNGDHSVYLDPDIQVRGSLEDIAGLARAHTLVLTPHNLTPMPRDGMVPSEQEILKAGAFNLGFVAVGRGSERFLEWWSDRLARDCISLQEKHLFVDQRWMDLVPAYFPHHVLRDPGCNVAYWNLATRALSGADGDYAVDGVPLRFFHFSGFDPDRPYLLSRFQGERPRILLSEHPALAELCGEYADLLISRGHREWRTTPYGWDHLPGGTVVSSPMRRIYRDGLLAAEWEGAQPPPDPWDATQSPDFLQWLRAPRDHTSTLPRYFAAVWDADESLQRQYHRPHGGDHRRFVSWIRDGGWREVGAPFELVPEQTAEPELRRQVSVRAKRAGINVAGYFRAESGVGEIGRKMIAAIEAAAIPHAVIPYLSAPQRQQLDVVAPGKATAEHDVNLICVNADQMHAFAQDVGPRFFNGRHSVGLWWWEVSRFPDSLLYAFDLVDEVWVGSEHVRAALEATGRGPVFTMPVPIEIPEPAPKRSSAPDDPYTFLFTFDFLSVVERKNPAGLIEAYSCAFAPGQGARLRIKTINGHLRAGELERLRLLAAGRPDIDVIDAYLSHGERRALLASSDCYVSLHRAEGYGLGLAEAMAAGKPVIATGYSGNLTFMTTENSHLVRHRMVAIPPGCDPYPAGAEWAEPDGDDAARLLRTVFEDRSQALALGARAREDMRRLHGVDQTAAFIRERYAQARRRPRLTAVAGRSVRRLRRRAWTGA